MGTLFRNRYLDALAKSYLCFAVFHDIILLVYVLRGGDAAALNIFTILDLHLLWPSLGEGLANHLLSVGAALIVYGIVFRLLTRPRVSATTTKY